MTKAAKLTEPFITTIFVPALFSSFRFERILRELISKNYHNLLSRVARGATLVDPFRQQAFCALVFTYLYSIPERHAKKKQPTVEKKRGWRNRKEARKDGRKEGRKEGKKERRLKNSRVVLRIVSLTFHSLQSRGCL